MGRQPGDKDQDRPGSGAQDEAIAFLGASSTYAGNPDVERIDTHGAIVFMAGDAAIKIKRAVRFSYMDFSTLDLRRGALEREFEINRRTAPELYLRVEPITREKDGALAIGGTGAAIEWVLVMQRFEQSALLGQVAERGALTRDLSRALADAVSESHATAAIARDRPGDEVIRQILVGLDEGIAACDLGHATFRHEDFRALAERRLSDVAPLLRSRSQAGFVRRCHGDLHLDNLVLWQGRPTLFDAIEFNDDLATIDTLYDLAFLLMDLDHRGCRAAANVVLNRYLWRSQGEADLAGLAALPLFLALRSAVRGLVGVQRSTQERSRQDGTAQRGSIEALARGRAHLDAAMTYLAPPGPRLIAVGGLSGTGKTTLAEGLAPTVGGAPGAVHLRTDLQRKIDAGVGETDRLPAAAYSAAASARTYDNVLARAATILKAGRSVVIDAVFARPAERAAVCALAAGCGATFHGVWLEAPRDVLVARVEGRRGDASDATAAVVRQQLDYDLGEIGWHKVDAGGDGATTLRVAKAAIEAGPH